MSVILLDNELVHYEILGRGRPIIFLHGWVGSWRYWIPCMQAASTSFRAYGIDLWGFGDSAKVPSRYALENQAELLNAFMEQMGMMRVALVGHGLGALVAMVFAQRYPELTDRIMTVSCPVEDALINSRLRTSTPVELAEWLLGKTPETETARLDAPKADMQAIGASLDSLPSLGLHELTNCLETPRLMVNGQNDPVIEAPSVDSLVGLPELTHQVIFEQSGHFPMFDEGTKFNRLLTDFLALASGESPRDLQLKEEWKRRIR